MSKIQDLLSKANSLPITPGVYLMKNDKGEVIYVGKAIKLKNRVSSYFRGTPQHPKTRKLVSEINDFEVVLAETELDALLTECSLIQRYNPFYNIKLKNGGGYPFIYLTEKEGLPLLKIEKNRLSRGHSFGPFTSAQTANTLIKLINKVFLLPVCASAKQKKSVTSRNGKGCIEYQIHSCKGFCRNDFSKEALKETNDGIIALLSGDTEEITEKLRTQMENAAENLEFEQAAALRDSICSLEKIKDLRKPTIANNRNADYISHTSNLNGDDSACSIFMLRIRNGFIIGERCDHFDECFTDELLNEYIERFYSENPKPNCKIYIDEGDYPWLPATNAWLGGLITFPSLTQDRDILELCRKNAIERRIQLEGKTKRSQRALEAFRQCTGLKRTEHIEVYDISSMAGELAVCGMISVIDGDLKPSLYRKFKIERNLIGNNDDTAYMQEAVTRRLKHYNDGDEAFSPLPDLIICDGALGQIHAVEKAVSDSGHDITVIGLKKDAKHRTKAVVFSDGSEISLVKFREAFMFCTQIQDEVHRYAISYHKSLRDALTRQSILTKIPGIGSKKARELFLKYKSIEKIASSTPEELATNQGINLKLANTILKWLKENY